MAVRQSGVARRDADAGSPTGGAPDLSGRRAWAPSTREVVLLVVIGVLVGVLVHTGWSRGRVAPPTSTEEGWSLVFSDDFDGPQLDTDRWTTCYWWDDGGCTNEGNDELEWYLPDNVGVADGTLRLTAEDDGIDAPDGETYPYTSGMVTSGRAVSDTSGSSRFAFRYGYVEVRARVPAGDGLWPALWLLPDTHDSKPEIDILEVDGADPRTGTAHIHFRDEDGDARSEGHDWRDADLSAGWHTFAVDWRADSVTWYVDGEERWRYTDADRVPREPMYLLMNLAVGGDWVGDPTADTTFPATFEIDHVKVWQRDADR